MLLSIYRGSFLGAWSVRFLVLYVMLASVISAITFEQKVRECIARDQANYPDTPMELLSLVGKAIVLFFSRGTHQMLAYQDCIESKRQWDIIQKECSDFYRFVCILGCSVWIAIFNLYSLICNAYELLGRLYIMAIQSLSWTSNLLICIVLTLCDFALWYMFIRKKTPAITKEKSNTKHTKANVDVKRNET
jgi:hypothetical protein